MAKKRASKWRAWNKGIELGQKDAFTPDQAKRIRQVLARCGGRGLRDLALFSVAIDTMLQGPELTIETRVCANETRTHASGRHRTIWPKPGRQSNRPRRDGRRAWAWWS